MGRRPIKFPSKVDCHPGKGCVNWWEAECGNDSNKKSERQKFKKDTIAEQIDYEINQGEPHEEYEY